MQPWVMFGRAVGFTLVLTAVAKVVTALHTPISIPAVPDQVLTFLTRRETALLASGFECLLAFLLFTAREPRRAAWVVIYFAACGTAYHLGLAMVGASTCGCLGAASGWIGLSSRTELMISRFLVTLFWVGGLIVLRVEASRLGDSPQPT
jgi:hypothetical protein